jgi:putative endonuclease
MIRWLPKRHPPSRSGEIGRRAELIARDYLESRGLRTLATNFRSRWGEIDLVMRDADCVVFVEVRFRRSSAWGSALESVDARKQARITRCALHYIDRHPSLAARAQRFDVVSVAPGKGDEAALDWIRDAFEPKG